MPVRERRSIHFVGDDGGENQFFATQALALAQRQRCGDEIARMARIGFPINIVVIHRANHVAVEKGRIHRIGLEPGHKRSGFAIPAAHRAVVLEQNLGIILLAPTKRAADGVEPK